MAAGQAPITAGATDVGIIPGGGGASSSVPQKRINSQAELEVFLKSRLCDQLISFLGELSEAVKGKPISPDRLENTSALLRGLVRLLDTVDSWIEEFPPLVQPMRFGNRAFAQWHSRLVERAEGLLATALAEGGSASHLDVPAFACELSHYLASSFGDPKRIDYGTGHEAAFLAIIFALGSRGVLAKTDAADTVLVLFARYVHVMRRLQTIYVLEPAGSHGVWGLDDFHHLPFLFGAAQLRDMEEEIPPGDVYKEKMIRVYADSFLYVDAINQVLLAKRGAPFHETSPMLYDITAVPTWQKIHAGLVKMYRAEVLGKFPVIQHFLFGPSLPWPGDQSPTRRQSAEDAARDARLMPPPARPLCSTG